MSIKKSTPAERAMYQKQMNSIWKPFHYICEEEKGCVTILRNTNSMAGSKAIAMATEVIQKMLYMPINVATKQQ